MKQLISKLKESDKAKRCLRILIIVLTTLYVFSIPSFSNRGGFNIIPYFCIALLILSTFAYIVLFRRFRFNFFLLSVPIFVTISFIGTLIYSHEYREWFSLVLLSITFFVFYYSFTSIGDKRIVFIILTIAISLFCIYFVIIYRNEILNFNSFEGESFRLGRYFDNPNGISSVCSIGLLSSLYLVLFSKSKLRFLSLFGTLLAILVGVATGSRTFIAAIIIILISLFYFRFKNHKWIFMIALISITVFVIVLLNLPFMNTIRERIINSLGTIFGFGTKVDTSTIERTVWSQYAFFLGSKNVLIGYGAKGFSIFSGVGTYSHSNYGEVLCNFGFLGFISFYSSLFLCIYLSIRNKNHNAFLIIVFAIYYFVVGFSYIFYYDKVYFLIIGFCYYLALMEPVVTKKTVKRIMFTCDSMHCGGAEKVIATLSNELVKQKYDVSVIIVSSKDKISYYPLNPLIKIEAICENAKKRVKIFKRLSLLRKAIKTNRPDIIVSFLPHVNVYTYFASLGLGIPIVVSERNNPYSDPKGKIARILKYISFLGSNGSVFQTKDAMYFYCKSIRKRSALIPNPISIDPSSVEHQDSLRNKTIIFVGRLTQQKNVTYLIDAFQLFLKNHSEYKLRIYGDGPLKDKLVEYVGRKGLHSSVIFLGNSTTWQRDEKNSSMFVLPSNYEGMPNALMEAMAIGIPCISTNCPIGGPRELINNGINGFLVEMDNRQELCDKMELALKPNFANAFSEHNRKMIELFSAKTIASKWIDFLESVVRKNDN